MDLIEGFSIIILIVLINENDNDEDKEPVYKFYKKYWGVIPLGIINYLVIITSRAFALSEIKVLTF